MRANRTEKIPKAWSVEPFDYDARRFEPGAEWGSWELAEVDEKGVSLMAPEAPNADQRRAEALPGVDFECRLEQEVRKAFDGGRDKGRQEGRLAERELNAAERQERTAQLGRLAEAFSAERGRYMSAVEQEVVKLALAVAARILRREAQMDPLLLLGAVRVALGQLAASTQVRLRVPPADVAMWTEAVALLPGLGPKPQVVAGEGMRLGDCVVETEMGTVDLGVRAQLSEIERGFFDRAALAAVPERAA